MEIPYGSNPYGDSLRQLQAYVALYRDVVCQAFPEHLAEFEDWGGQAGRNCKGFRAGAIVGGAGQIFKCCVG